MTDHNISNGSGIDIAPTENENNISNQEPSSRNTSFSETISQKEAEYKAVEEKKQEKGRLNKTVLPEIAANQQKKQFIDIADQKTVELKPLIFDSQAEKEKMATLLAISGKKGDISFANMVEKLKAIKTAKVK